MERAAVRARDAFKIFWRELSWEYRRIVPGLELAAVKATFSDPPGPEANHTDGVNVEHMWVVDPEFDGQQLQGTLINSPHSLKSYSEGDRVTILNDRIFDWMYVISGEVYGGFTVDVLRSRMGSGERRQHDNAWGFHFGDVGNVLLVPPDYIGDPPLKKGGLFSFVSKTEPASQDLERVAAIEHPMSVNMRESLENAIREAPSMLAETDQHGFNYLHQLSLAGSLGGVDVCLSQGADPNQPAGNKMTPFQLAKSLGWSKVMERIQQAGGE